MRLSTTLLWLGALGAPGLVAGEFRFQVLDGKSLRLSEDGRPVFVYNYGSILRPGVPPDRARCCYLHPIYAPNNVVISDDFPADHYHHRGLSWAWPEVRVDGATHDLWALQGILPRFEKWLRRTAAKDKAVLAVENGWYVGNSRVVIEDVEITAYPAVKGRQDLGFVLQLRAVDHDVQIAGRQEGRKGYGGFNLRFAPRTDTVIRYPGQKSAADSDLQPAPWAELTGVFDGGRAGARITIDASNSGFPNGWCLRKYGYLGVDFPGLETWTLTKGVALILKYRVSLLSGKEASRR